MVAFLLSVALISLSGVMIPGPNFAVVVAKSYKSPLAGTKVAFGHALVEVPVMLVIYFGLANFFQDELVQIVLSLLGGGMLVLVGLGLFRRARSADEAARDLPYNSIASGAATSAFNPMFILWWATVGSMLVMKSLSFGLVGFGLFIPVHLACDFIWRVISSGFPLFPFWSIRLGHSGEGNFKPGSLRPQGSCFLVSGPGF